MMTAKELLVIMTGVTRQISVKDLIGKVEKLKALADKKGEADKKVTLERAVDF